jgi:polyvinyl alcohol dehydrogenase (cytochrome)
MKKNRQDSTHRSRLFNGALAVATLLLSSQTLAQEQGQWLTRPAGPPAGGEPMRFGAGLIGQMIFLEHCATCHKNDAPASGADEKIGPTLPTLQQYPPERIYEALTHGKMKVMAANLPDEQRRQIAEWLASRPIGSVEAGDSAKMPNRCAANPPFDPNKGSTWNGWGATTDNARFQSAKQARLTSADLPKLKLAWAFGIPNGVETYSQPTVAAGRVFFGTDNGYVYSVDAKAGCVYWSYYAEGGVRTAPVVAPIKGQGATKYALYLGDMRGFAQAIDAQTGKSLWKTRVDDLPLSKVTGTPAVHDGRVYLGISSAESVSAASPNYECCTFRGAVLALDANSGKVLWKTYMIPQAPAPRGVAPNGTRLFGPAGASVWNSPTVDAKRGKLYVGTGNAYTQPAARLSDSIVALELATGKVAWSHQDIPGDAWIAGCPSQSKPSSNCPEKLGPDWDFGGASMILRKLPDGRDVVIGASKGGFVVAVDPDKQGTLVWRTKLGDQPAGPNGLIVFGGSADAENAYYALQSGALASVKLATGEHRWLTPLQPPADRPKRRGQSAATSTIPGVVFSGGWDGVLRAASASDGRVMWEFDTSREFSTVNGVPGKGGSMGAPGATIVDGMLFVGSGYIGTGNGMPGNVMIALSAGE